MKPFLLCCLLFCLLFTAGTAARGADAILVGSLATLTGTNNTAGQAAAGVILPRASYGIQNGNLPSTNALLVNFQWSLDLTNYVTFAAWGPSSTNAGSVTFTPALPPQTIYVRAQVITTNAQQVGIVPR